VKYILEELDIPEAVWVFLVEEFGSLLVPWTLRETAYTMRLKLRQGRI